MRNWMVKTVGILVGSMLVLSGCSVVVKVQKKPKASSVSSATQQMNLTDGTTSYLDSLDNVTKSRAVLIDQLIANYNGKDWPIKFRQAIRKYRAFLIAKAQSDVKVNDSFYTSSADCRDIGLNFDVDDANKYFGMILQTAFLAKLSSAGKIHLNPEIEKVLSIVQKLVELELGVKIDIAKENTADESADGLKLTGASIKISIVGDVPGDPATAADKVEVMTLNFTRTLGAEVGKADTFEAKVSVVHLLDQTGKDSATETLEATLTAKREKSAEGSLLHTATFTLGKDGKARYQRSVLFEQISKTVVKITDTMLVPAGTPVVTYIDVKKGKQCKTPFEDIQGKDDQETIPDTTPTPTPTPTQTPECTKDKNGNCWTDDGDDTSGKDGDITVIVDPNKNGNQSQQQSSTNNQTITVSPSK